MRRHPLRILPLLLLLLTTTMPMTSCATVLGTIVGPITGGVDLARRHIWRGNWAATPFYFIGGAVAGPFVAFYNGINHDASVFANFTGYWMRFDEVFRPFETVVDD